MIKPPPLPTPTIVDGRSLYTSGDMREYAKKYAQATMVAIDVIGSADINHSASGQAEKPDVVSELFKCFGLTSSPSLRAGIPKPLNTFMFNNLEVRTSMGTTLQSLSLARFHIPSMRRNGQPDRLYVRGRVVVPVVMHAASGALPILDAKHYGAVDVTAGRAHLAARKPTVDLHDLAPVALGLGLQQPGKYPDSSVRNAARKAVVFDHSAQVQVFNANRVESLHHVGGELVRRVHSGVSDLGVQLGDDSRSMLSPIATLSLARQSALQERHALSMFIPVFRVGDALASGQRSKPVQPEINANGLTGLWQLNRLNFNNERNEVAARGITLDSQAGGVQNGVARPLNLDGTYLCQCQCVRFNVQLESAFGVLRALRAVLSFEARVAGSLLKEVLVGGLQVAQALLQRHAGNIVQPGGIRLGLQLCQSGACLRVADALAVLEPDAA